MPILTQADFLQTPCPASANQSAVSSSILEADFDDSFEATQDYRRLRSSANTQPRRPPPTQVAPPVPRWDEILAPKPQQASSTANKRSSIAPVRRPPVGSGRTSAMGPPAKIRKNQAGKIEVYAAPQEEKSLPHRARVSVEPKRAPVKEGKPLAKKVENTELNKGAKASGKENVPVARKGLGVKAALGERKDTNVKMKAVSAKSLKDLKPTLKDSKSSLKESKLEVVVKPKLTRKRSSSEMGKLRLVKRAKRDSNDDSIISTSSAGSSFVEDESFTLPTEIPLPRPAFNRLINFNKGPSAAMYESWWLDAQESSITQLLNALFKQNTPDRTKYDPFGVRQDMLNIYSSPSFPLLHRKLQASLHVGALAPTKEVLAKSSIKPGTALSGGKNGKGWGEDVGLSGKFLELFVETYDTDLLATALEVVIGREVFPSGDSRPFTRRERKKTVEAFMMKFIVACEDALLMPPASVTAKGQKGVKRGSADDDDWGTAGWVWRRSVLRSLMLILLLDKAKTEGVVTSCLFQTTSQHKTSTSIVQQLARLLLPALGDVIRPLVHLGYTVKAEQYALQEFNYKIENIAVDLRDGIRLVRIVELLLYPNSDPNSPTWPLSSHIKFPAIGRAQKLYNITLALRALDQVGANKGGVTATDVADGYRERTIGLLLEIMQRWGLGCLVEWDELKREIRRLERKAGKGRAVDDLEELSPSEEFAEEKLLARWAGCIAEKRGLRMSGLENGFSDGKIFQAIIEEYEDFFPRKTTPGEGLDSKLASLGCNSYFASLFGKHIRNGLVFDKDFVVQSLAFLSSRLVAFSARQRAATTIQAAFRTFKFRKDVHKRINLMLLAHDCAVIVKRKERLVNAAITIQRTYRKHLEKTMAQLITRVTGIQAAARRFLAVKQFKDIQAMTLVVQRTWRQIRDERFYKRMGVAKEAFTGLQASIRGYLQRERYWQMKAAVVVIEEHWQRAHLCLQARRSYLEKKKAVAVICTAWSTYLATRTERIHFLTTTKSITSLQSLIRGHLVRKKYTQDLADLALAKRQITTRLARKHYLSLLQHTLSLQRHTRQILPLLRARRAEQGIIKLQSLWRGHLIRKHAPARFKIYRARIEKATERGGETLGEKVRRGVELLRRGGANANRGLMAVESALVARECVRIAREEGVLELVCEMVEKAKGKVPGRQVGAGVRVVERCAGVIGEGDVRALRRLGEVLKGRGGKEWAEVRERVEGVLRVEG